MSRSLIELSASALRQHAKADILPPLSDEEFEGLRQDVEHRGIQTPLLVTRRNVVLAGHHRLKVAKALGLKTVPAIVLDGLTPAEELSHLVLDNLHRRHLSPSQRAAIATMPAISDAILKVYREEAKARQLAAGVHGSKGGRGKKTLQATVPGGNPQTRDRVGGLAGVSGKMIDHALLGWKRAPDRMKAVIEGNKTQTVSQIAHEVRRGDKASATEKAILRGVKGFEKFFRLQTFDIWSFQGLDAGFGKKWPGNIPASLVANAVYYFTDPGDLVVDPMAGGGVTGDVCRVLDRRCTMADLVPSSATVKKHRIESGPIPGTNGKAALVFLDPPYWSLKIEKYDEEAAAWLSWTDWCRWLWKMAKSAASMAKKGGFVTCLMQDSLTRDVERFEPGRSSIVEATRALEAAGLEPVTMIACPLPTQQSSKYDVEWAKREQRLLGVNRQLLVFRKG